MASKFKYLKKMIVTISKGKRKGQKELRYFYKGDKVPGGAGKAAASAAKAPAFETWSKGELRTALSKLRKKMRTTTNLSEAERLSHRAVAMEKAILRKAMQRKPAPVRGPRPKKKKPFIGVSKPFVSRGGFR